MTDSNTTRVELGGVPETLLWTLYNRAVEARRIGGVIDDPLAVELLATIDYPFESRFGKATWSQAQALRARKFDEAVCDFMAVHPDGTVVALGEGLETSFWRVDNGLIHWLTVDLPEVIELRRRLLPESTRLAAVSGSALDTGWMDAINPGSPVLITAQGLLMYLDRADVDCLIDACAKQFPGGTIVFDVVPHWLSRTTTGGEAATTRGYEVPQMLWGMDADEVGSIRAASSKIADVVELRPPRGRGIFYGLVMPLAHRIPVLHNKRTPAFPWVLFSVLFQG